MSTIRPVDRRALPGAVQHKRNFPWQDGTISGHFTESPAPLRVAAACVRECESAYGADGPLEREYDAVHRFLKVLCRDRHLAEDLVQQTYLRAYVHFARHDPVIERPREWLFTIARCAYIDYVRHRALRPEARPESLDFIADPRADREAEVVCVREAIAKLGRGIEELDPLSRALLLGYHIEGESFRDLAARHGLSRTAARVRVFRARRQLRRRLG